MGNIELFGAPLIDLNNFIEMVVRFTVNLAFIWYIINNLYYPRSRRKEYYFTFMLISISVFMLSYLLGGVKIKTGFVLGLFAIFGIIRYRTETMSVREMTYLFVIITVSIINALATTVGLVEIMLANVVVIIAIKLCESNRNMNNREDKYVVYDKIELIRPDKKEELIADLKQRLGLDILDVEVGAVDFLKDTAMLKVSYESDTISKNTTNRMLKLPKQND